MQLTTEKADTLKEKPEDTKLGFGTLFTDHMFNMDYHPDHGWHHPRIEPYHEGARGRSQRGDSGAGMPV